jgi:hypothetical protein
MLSSSQFSFWTGEFWRIERWTDLTLSYYPEYEEIYSKPTHLSTLVIKFHFSLTGPALIAIKDLRANGPPHN